MQKFKYLEIGETVETLKSKKFILKCQQCLNYQRSVNAGAVENKYRIKDKNVKYVNT